MQLIRQLRTDLSQKPFMVIWETTQACDLVCKHCRAVSQKEHHPQALSFDEGKMLIEQIDSFGEPHPLLIMTGGDPFKRNDIFELAAYAAQKKMTAALSPSGTPLLNPANLQKLKEAGSKVISLSLDGSTPEIHDSFRGVEGSFAWTVEGWKAARSLGLKTQINTTVTRYNLMDLPAIFALVQEIGVMTWSLFFLVPTGRGTKEDEISARDYEAVMNFLYDLSKHIRIKCTEGHHYKRVVLQRAYLEAQNLPVREYMELNETYDALLDGLRRAVPNLPPAQNPDRIRRTPLYINAGDGFVFVSLLGEVFPSGYLPVSAGNIRRTPLPDIYRDSSLFRSLRDKSKLKGRCGACEYKTVCGGSRSRAYAMTGDVFAEEPFCAYRPQSFPFSQHIPDISGNENTKNET